MADPDPTMAQIKQRPQKGDGLENRKDVLEIRIRKEKERIGGDCDWTLGMRDFIRWILFNKYI